MSFDEPHPSPAQLEAWDAAHLWHPFTPHSVYRDEAPLMVVAGEGNTLVDIEGRRYIDAVGSIWCNLFGHRREEIDGAIVEQLGRIAHSTLLGNSHPLAVRLARQLVEITPAELTRVFFSDNGSTAVEVALKIAFQYWQQVDGGRLSQKRRFVTFGSAYHGDTIGSVSLGGIDLFHARYGDLLFDTLVAPTPYVYRSELGREPDEVCRNCVAALERILAEHRDEVAGVLLEPGFQGAAGIITQPPGFVRAVGEATRQAGALLIFDEVAVGLGRSGRMFACEREGVTPDLLCLAKGLTGGYLPLAATLATEPIFAAFVAPPADNKTFFHGHTYTGNPLGAAAALATLQLFARERVLESLPAKIEHLATALERLRPLPPVGDIRQYGLAAGVELVANKASRERFAAAERRGARVCVAAREHGVFLRPLGDVIVIMPPLSIDLQEIDRIVDAIAAGIERVCT